VGEALLAAHGTPGFGSARHPAPDGERETMGRAARHGKMMEISIAAATAHHARRIGSPRYLAALCMLLLLAGIWQPRAAQAALCAGDCNGDHTVTVDELLTGVGIALGLQPMAQCPYFDNNADGQVTVDEILTGVSAAATGCPQPLIMTVAGNGVAGFNGDGQDPLDTALYLPQDATVGPDGLLYFADWNNHRIRRVRDGKVETVAGTGDLGDAQDGPALETNFNHPTNVCFDAQGNMLVAAWHNSVVKRVDFATGEIINIAGTGARAYGGDGGPGNSAKLDLPSSVVLDTQGNIIISDQANFRLRVLHPDGIIDTLCGTGVAGYDGDGGPALQAELRSPTGQAAAPAGRIAIDQHDRLYIADTGNHAVRTIDTDGAIKTIAGSGVAGYNGDGSLALFAQLDTPSDVAVDSNGTIFIADTMNNAVRMITPDGIMHTLAGTGQSGYDGDVGVATQSALDRPYGVTVAPNGDVYVADTHNHRIRKISGTSGGKAPPPPPPTPTPNIVPCTDVVGSICTYAGNGDTGFNGDGLDRLHTALYWPFDIEFTATGRRVVLDWNNHKVREILPDDTFKTIVGTDFIGDGPEDLSDLTPGGADPLSVNLNHPTDVQEFPNGDLMLMCWHNHKIRVADHTTGRVRVLAGAGAGFNGDGGPAHSALLNQPPHGALDATGNLFFIDQRNERIRVIYRFSDQRENAIINTVVGTGEKGFNGDGLALSTQLNFPAGPNPEPSGSLTLDSQGRLYFSDTLNNRIRRVEFFVSDFSNGVVTTIAGTGDAGYSGDGGPAQAAQINYPQDLEIGPDGNLYFADTNNNVVRKIDLATGIIQTVVGTGQAGYAGDGGPAIAAQLVRPFGIGFDDKGDLYVSDTFNSRIRKVKLSPTTP
jgi:sugar lactone lactonase YvrE